MTLLGDDEPTMRDLGWTDIDQQMRDAFPQVSVNRGGIRYGIRYCNLATNPLTITWPVTASFTVDNVSPEVVAILTGQPQGETLL